MFLNPESRAFVSSLERTSDALPIAVYRRVLLHAVTTHDVVLLVGETGSGKTTQVPQFLADAGWADGGRCICCTQPRRVAAVSVAQRVASERRTPVGDDVGYAVRFDECAKEGRTHMKFVTDGVLVRECMLDPMLSRYSVVMVDEAHERRVATDLVLGLLKKIQRARRDLKLIVSSATMDIEAFYEFFRAPSTRVTLVHVPGRAYPVEINYARAPVADCVAEAIRVVLALHRRAARDAGDVLVFVAGADEIERIVRILDDESTRLSSSSSAGLRRLVALPLHASLPPAAQLAALSPAARDARKVIVATNVAEASVTIDGVRYVVDTGFEKLRVGGALVRVPCSRASLEQRAGRAGRTAAGVTYRLFTEAALRTLPPRQAPEMTRTDFVGVLLQLKALGVDNLLAFDFVSPPAAVDVVHALERLHALGALDDAGRLTQPRGVRMAELPLAPSLAAALLAAVETADAACVARALDIVAVLSCNDGGGAIWSAPPAARSGVASSATTVTALESYAVKEGDLLTYSNLLRAFEKAAKSGAGAATRWCESTRVHVGALRSASQVRRQLAAFVRRFGTAAAGDGGGGAGGGGGNKRKATQMSGGRDEEEDATGALVRRCMTAGLFMNAARFNRDDQVYRLLAPPDAAFAASGAPPAALALTLHTSSVLCALSPPPSLVIFGALHRVDARHATLQHVSTIDDIGWLTSLAPHFYSSRD